MPTLILLLSSSIDGLMGLDGLLQIFESLRSGRQHVAQGESAKPWVNRARTSKPA